MDFPQNWGHTEALSRGGRTLTGAETGVLAGGIGSPQTSPTLCSLTPIRLTALLYSAAQGKWLPLSEPGFTLRKTGRRWDIATGLAF